ncbi:MAG: hypothetical protein WBB29_02430 [Geitlerinemataceae cyanobacterium]
MFISNQLSKCLFPTAVALVLTALAQWLTHETDRLSVRKESVLASASTLDPGSKISTRSTYSNSSDRLSSRGNEDVGATTSPRRHSRWRRYWKDRSTRWRRNLEAFWLEGEVGEMRTIATDGWVAFSPLAQTISYQQKYFGDPIVRLFSTPDSPGSIAIGAAEGTRTFEGEVTSEYWGHRDPANGVTNLGTFSYQHGAGDARQADSIQLDRLQQQMADIQRQAQESGVVLSSLELVAAADLTNQSPAAGYAYIPNLKQAYDRGFHGIEALLEARMQSFVNPQTQNLDAAGFSNNWQRLRQDQLRRLSKLQKTLKAQGAL